MLFLGIAHIHFQLPIVAVLYEFQKLRVPTDQTCICGQEVFLNIQHVPRAESPAPLAPGLGARSQHAPARVLRLSRFDIVFYFVS